MNFKYELGVQANLSLNPCYLWSQPEQHFLSLRLKVHTCNST